MAATQRRIPQAPPHSPVLTEADETYSTIAENANDQFAGGVTGYPRRHSAKTILLFAYLCLGLVAPFLLLTGVTVLGSVFAVLLVGMLGIAVLATHYPQRGLAVRQRGDIRGASSRRRFPLRAITIFSCVGIICGTLLGIAMQGQTALAASPSVAVGSTADSANGLAFSPDGTALALETPTGIAIVNRATGAITQQLPFPTPGFVAGQSRIAIAWNPTLLAATYRVGAGADATDAVTVWHIDSGAVQFTAALAGAVSNLVWSPDGATLAGYLPPQSPGDFGVILQWDVTTGTSKTPIFTTNTPSVAQNNALFSWSPDPTRLAVVNDSHTVLILDLRFTDSIERFTAAQAITALSWSPDGTLLAIGHGDGSVGLLDMRTLTMAHTIMTQPRAVLYLAWSPDSRRVLAANDAALAVIDVAAARTLTAFDRPASQHAQSVPVAAGSGLQPLTNITQSAAVTIVGVMWSADGAFIGAHYSDGTLVSWSAHAIGG